MALHFFFFATVKMTRNHVMCKLFRYHGDRSGVEDDRVAYLNQNWNMSHLNNIAHEELVFIDYLLFY